MRSVRAGAASIVMCCIAVISRIGNGDVVEVRLPTGFGLAQSPGDGRLYVTTFNTGQVQVVDPLTRTRVDSFVVGGGAR